MNGTANESFGPTVTDDRLEMFFTSLRTSTDYDLYRATRATTSDEFTGVTYVSALSDFGKDVHPTITEDGLTIIFSSARPNAYGGLDLFQSARPTRQGSWTAPTTITALASEDDDYNPSVIGSGQRIVFSRSPSGGGQSTLWEAAYVVVAWGAPVHRAELDSPGLNEAPALSSDGRTLLFASDRESAAVTHLYVARRKTLDDAFVCIERAPGLWVDGKADSDPFVTRDGGELYFASKRTDGSWQIHRSLVY
ncbi:MAG: PD40 domain-containing protein [Deltaproteobacteria bacterium]|nr:PD40 domain-containing protein [Deltaproteobacteria bacterium]